MHSPLLRVIMSLVAVGVTSATQPISLSNFTPRIENLPTQCQNAYTSTISGCQEADFADNARCSSNCVQGLIAISQLVNKECGNVDVPETSIIGVFLLGKGVEALCPGITVTTVGSSSTDAAPVKGTPAPPETTQEQSSAQATESAPSASSSDTASPPSSSQAASSTAANSPNQPVATPSSTSSAQLTFDTATPPVATPPAAAQQTTNGQKSNQDSGGGSPFDVQAVSSSSQVGFGAVTAILGIAVMFTAFL